MQVAYAVDNADSQSRTILMLTLHCGSYVFEVLLRTRDFLKEVSMLYQAKGWSCHSVHFCCNSAQQAHWVSLTNCVLQGTHDWGACHELVVHHIQGR